VSAHSVQFKLIIQIDDDNQYYLIAIQLLLNIITVLKRFKFNKN